MTSTAPREVAPTPVGNGQRGHLGDKAGVVVAARVIVGVAQIGTTLALVRLLAKDQVGVLTFLLLLYQTVSGLAIFGFPQGLLYFMPRLEAGQRKVFVLLTTLILAGLGLLGGLMLLGLGGFLTSDLPGARPLLPLIALYIALDLPTQALPNLLISLDRTALAARLNIAFSLMTMAALLVPASLGAPLPLVLTIFAASAAVRLAAFAVVVVHVVFAVPGSLTPTTWREHARALLRFAVPLGMSSSVGLLNQQIDKYLIWISFSATAYAEYAVGAQELPLVSILPYTVATVLMPTFVEHWTADRPREMLAVWHASIHKVALVMLPVAVFLFICADEYVSVLFTSDYARAAGPVRVYLLLLPLRVTAFGVILQALGDTRAVLIVAAIGLVLNALGSAAFIAWFGFLGPSLATVAVQFLLGALILMLIGRHTRVGIADIFPWRGYLGVCLVALLAAPIALGLREVLSDSPGTVLGVSAAGYFASYFLIASWTGVITAADRAWLARRLLRRGEPAPP